MKYEVKNYVIYKYEVFLTYFDEFGNEAKIIPVNQRDVSNVVFNGDENIWSRNLILEIAITNPSALKYEVKNSFKRLYIYIYRLQVFSSNFSYFPVEKIVDNRNDYETIKNNKLRYRGEQHRDNLNSRFYDLLKY